MAGPRRRPGRLDLALGGVVLLFVVGWGAAIAEAGASGTRPGWAARLTISPFSPQAPPEAAVLADVVVREMADYEVWRGESGALRVAVVEPGDTAALGLRRVTPEDSAAAGTAADTAADARPEPGVVTELRADTADGLGPVDVAGADTQRGAARTGTVSQPPAEPGIWEVLLRKGRLRRSIPGFAVITTVPGSEIRDGRIGRYLIGRWPEQNERSGRFRGPRYDPPRGLIAVTPENRDVPVSEHFELGDFLTKGQEDVWPKYVAMSTRLLDKLELTLQQLEAMGHPVDNVGIISGFRTPQYNVAGGNTSGRGSLSRHMYGDAMDFYIDNDRDGRMDDLNGDGRIDIGDARVIAEAANAVETEFPHLVGGVGVYRPTGAHSGFVHVDTRGYRARW